MSEFVPNSVEKQFVGMFEICKLLNVNYKDSADKEAIIFKHIKDTCDNVIKPALINICEQHWLKYINRIALNKKHSDAHIKKRKAKNIDD